MVKLIVIILLSLVGALLYRLGGIGKPFNTKFRDLGVPVVCSIVLLMLFYGKSNIWKLIGGLFIHFGLLFGSLTTYFKKGPDSKWWNWALCGLAFGLSALPIAFITGHWIMFIVRTMILAVCVSAWSEVIDKDWLEEGGRGLLIVSTLPILAL